MPFKGIWNGAGQVGVTCATPSRCVAFGGLDYRAGSAYLFVTNDAPKGADSSWTRAALPALREESKFRHVAFAPGGTRGWTVGMVGAANPLVLETGDGGASWKDVTGSVRALAPSVRLHSVYAFDAEHIWIGGEQGTLLTTGN